VSVAVEASLAHFLAVVEDDQGEVVEDGDLACRIHAMLHMTVV
jgi:hypothetical protein